MLKKLLGNKKHRNSPDRAHVERLLAGIALETPQVEWIALVTSNGGCIGSFPSIPEITIDTIAAMSAAMSAIGERIAFELKDGDLQYILIAGTSSVSVTIELDIEYFLTIRLKKEVSIEGFLAQLQKTNLPLLAKALRLENMHQLSGVQQK